MQKCLLTLICLIFLYGCAANKRPVATGGSKADGTVVLSYETRVYEKPKVDWNLAKKEATRRCSAWGYNSAERFGGADFYPGFKSDTVSVTYQCRNK